MNAANLIATILSLVLAGATAASTGNNPAMDRPAPPGVNLNHNETLVYEKDYQRPNDARFWLTTEQAETVAPVLIQLSLIGTQCNPLTCGSNHNETFISDER